MHTGRVDQETFYYLLNYQSQQQNKWYLVCTGVESGQLWVGGKRDSNGDFFWKGKQDTSFTYTNWHSTEPSRWSDDDQNCMESSWEANKYMWFVYECTDEYNYACEYYE